MFNRQPFNRGKFNTSNDRSINLHGNASVSLETSGSVIAVKSFEGLAKTSLLMSGNVSFVNTLSGNANIALYSDNYFGVIKSLTDMLVSGSMLKVRNLGDAFNVNENSSLNRLHFNRGKFLYKQ